MTTRAKKPAARAAKPAPKPAAKPRAAARSAASASPPPEPPAPPEPAPDRAWRDMASDAPFCPRTERYKPHGEVELMLHGEPVRARWGAYMTSSNGKAYAWIGRGNQRLCDFADPTGWREVEARA